MGAKKAKRRKPLSSNRGLSDSATIPVYEGEILLTYRLPTEPHDQAVFLHAMLNKYMFIEGGRMLGRRTSDGEFETVLGFVDQKSVNRTMKNIRTSLKIDLDKWAVAPGSESVAKLEPIGQFLDEEDNHTIASILASDPDAIQANQEGIAERMDKERSKPGWAVYFPGPIRRRLQRDTREPKPQAELEHWSGNRTPCMDDSHEQRPSCSPSRIVTPPVPCVERTVASHDS